MEEDDKPFSCSVCKATFSNEDHLSVHKKKHDFVLNLNTSTPKISDLSDQTPTPTRFIKNCEDVGLFSELNNPFDEQFRRASQSGIIGLLNSSTQPTESLNTPYIPLATSDILPSKNHAFLAREVIATKSMAIPSPEDSDTNPFPTNNQETPTSVTTKVITTKINSPKVITVCKAPQIENSGQKTVITSVGLSATKHKLSGVPTAVVVKPRPNVSSTSSLKNVVKTTTITPTTSLAVASDTAVTAVTSSQGSSVLQLVLKFQDGQSMPFNIPVIPLNAAGVPQNVVAVATASTGVTTAQIPTMAKMKLRDTLEQQILQKPTNVVKTVSSTIKMNQSPLTISPQPIIVNTANVINQNNIAAVVPTVRATNIHTINLSGLESKKEEDEDPDEKKRKFLERNRAAAQRCRRKRKEKYDALEIKADELNRTNEQLQGMVAMLRKEVTQLKAMLLAHKDCPITLQQIAAGQKDAVELCSVAINLESLRSSANASFQTVSGLTNIDGGGMQLRIINEEDFSQGSISNMGSTVEPMSGVDSSNEDSPYVTAD